jgi:hypothetical protein
LWGISPEGGGTRREGSKQRHPFRPAQGTPTVDGIGARLTGNLTVGARPAAAVQVQGYYATIWTTALIVARSKGIVRLVGAVPAKSAKWALLKE